MRRPNTDIHGWFWGTDVREAVWEKAAPVRGYDKNVYRRDRCGAWIRFQDFGKTRYTRYGWEIDHIKPVEKGGTDALENLQPLHWRNNRQKAEKYPSGEEDCALKQY